MGPPKSSKSIQRRSPHLHPSIQALRELLLDVLSTFTSSELLPYNDFVALTVIANTLSLKRVNLKKKVSLFLLASRILLNFLFSTESSTHQKSIKSS